MSNTKEATKAKTEATTETKEKKEYKRYEIPRDDKGQPKFRENSTVGILFDLYKKHGPDAKKLADALQKKVDAKEAKSNNVSARVKRCLAEFKKAGV